MDSSTRRGFTLIELLVVVAIMAILSAIGIPAYNGYVVDSRRAAATNALRNIYLAQLDERAQTGGYYDSSAAAGDCTAATMATVASALNDRAAIVQDLFAGADLVNVENYRFCIEGDATTFTAWASNNAPGGVTACSIDQNNQINNAAGTVVDQC